MSLLPLESPSHAGTESPQHVLTNLSQSVGSRTVHCYRNIQSFGEANQIDIMWSDNTNPFTWLGGNLWRQCTLTNGDGSNHTESYGLISAPPEINNQQSTDNHFWGSSDKINQVYTNQFAPPTTITLSNSVLLDNAAQSVFNILCNANGTPNNFALAALALLTFAFGNSGNAFRYYSFNDAPGPDEAAGLPAKNGFDGTLRSTQDPNQIPTELPAFSVPYSYVACFPSPSGTGENGGEIHLAISQIIARGSYTLNSYLLVFDMAAVVINRILLSSTGGSAQGVITIPLPNISGTPLWQFLGVLPKQYYTGRAFGTVPLGYLTEFVQN